MKKRYTINYNIIAGTHCKYPQLFELSKRVVSEQNDIRINTEAFDSPPHSWPLNKLSCIIKRPNEIHLDWDVLWNYKLSRVHEIINELGIDVLYQRSESRFSPIYEDGLKGFNDDGAFMPYNAGVSFFSQDAAYFAMKDMHALTLDSFNACSTYEQLILPTRMKKHGLKVCTLEDISCFLEQDIIHSSWWKSEVFQSLVKLKAGIPGLGFFHLCGSTKERFDYNELYDFLIGKRFNASVGLGDVIESVAQPIARVIDDLAGTNIQGCGGCKKRKEYLNEKFPIT
jgi:hypothetical protein